MLEPWNDLESDAPTVGTPNGPRLNACRCADCGRVHFPKILFCRDCLGQNLAAEELSALGTLYAFTTIRTVEKPYSVGYIDLPEGLRVFGRIDDSVTGVRIGAEVDLVGVGNPLLFAPVSGVRNG